MAITLVGNAFVSSGGGSGGGSGGLAIENCKGFVHVFSDDGNGGKSSGFYDIDPPIPDVEGSKALILGVPLGFQEIVQPTTTLDDKRVLYLFGSAWNSISVAGILLLGTQETRGAQLGALTNWFNTNRVSKLRGPIRVSLGTVAIDAFVTGLSLSQANPQTNTQQFMITMLTADVE